MYSTNCQLPICVAKDNENYLNTRTVLYIF